MSYDSHCYDLAVLFLMDHEDKRISEQISKHAERLAQVIQDAIEAEIVEMEEEEGVGNGD